MNCAHRNMKQMRCSFAFNFTSRVGKSSNPSHPPKKKNGWVWGRLPHSGLTNPNQRWHILLGKKKQNKTRELGQCGWHVNYKRCTWKAWTWWWQRFCTKWSREGECCLERENENLVLSEIFSPLNWILISNVTILTVSSLKTRTMSASFHLEYIGTQWMLNHNHWGEAKEAEIKESKGKQ